MSEKLGHYTDEPELVGFDGNAAVIDGGVSAATYEEAKEKREAFKRENPDADVPDLEAFVSEVMS